MFHVSSVKPEFRRLTSFLLTRVSKDYAGFHSPQTRNIGSTKTESTEFIPGFSLTDDRWVMFQLMDMKTEKKFKRVVLFPSPNSF
jgi:hypothetical protein